MNQKKWLITGCSSGFGRATAEAALAAGQGVIATARDVEQWGEVAVNTDFPN
jgi:NAD(P)-dependent dehydrogenase (short-subunit alcohol dehydrogenase family)